MSHAYDQLSVFGFYTSFLSLLPMVFVAWILAIAFREAGHFFAAILVGFRIQSVHVGPLFVFRTYQGFDLGPAATFLSWVDARCARSRPPRRRRERCSREILVERVVRIPRNGRRAREARVRYALDRSTRRSPSRVPSARSGCSATSRRLNERRSASSRRGTPYVGLRIASVEHDSMQISTPEFRGKLLVVSYPINLAGGSVGLWHTHGCKDANLPGNPEDFSNPPGVAPGKPNDLGNIWRVDQIAQTALSSYLGTPSGQILRFTPSINSPVGTDASGLPVYPGTLTPLGTVCHPSQTGGACRK